MDFSRRIHRQNVVNLAVYPTKPRRRITRRTVVHQNFLFAFLKIFRDGVGCDDEMCVCVRPTVWTTNRHWEICPPQRALAGRSGPCTHHASYRLTAQHVMREDLQLRLVLALDASGSKAAAPKLPSCPPSYEIGACGGGVDTLPHTWYHLVNACFPEQEHPFDKHQFVKQFVSQPQFDPAGLFMITTRSEVVGTVFAWQEDPSTARIHWFAVHPEHRGKGLGKLLLEHAIHYCRQHCHHPKVSLHTQGHRVAAIRLCQSLGFVIDPVFGDASVCASALRIVTIPAGTFLGFKACPGPDAAQMLAHCARHDGISASRDPVWSGIYVQLSLAQAINYLPNQYERPMGHPLYLHKRLASVVELSVGASGEHVKDGLSVAITDDPRMADTRISNHDKAWLIFDQMRRTWPDDDVDVRDLWSRLKAEDRIRKENRKASSVGAAAAGAYVVAADEENTGDEMQCRRPVVIMDSFARKNMALCLLDAENYELCLPHALFHADVLQTRTLFCFPESREAPGCIGSVEYVEGEGQNMDASAFADKLGRRLSNKWDLFDAAKLSKIVQGVVFESGSIVQANWMSGCS